MNINDVNVIGGELSQEEINAYMKYVEDKSPNELLSELSITLDGEYVDLDYKFTPVPIERIRRITGYLVGTLDRFNDAKRAEVEDRVKHMSMSCCN